jgi:hypothetical protein
MWQIASIENHRILKRVGNSQTTFTHAQSILVLPFVKSIFCFTELDITIYMKNS